MGWQQKLPAKAAELETIQTEPLSTETIDFELPETQPAIPTDTTEEVKETIPPPTQSQDAEPIPTQQQETEPIPTQQETEPIATTAPTETSADETTLPQTEETEALELTELIAEETEPAADAGVQEGDLSTVSGQGITFRLFNYSTDINKTAGAAAWRPISSYFTFRNSRKESGTDPVSVDIPNPSINTEHDQDGFTKHHATVERVLENGYPVLDLGRNADGTGRTDPGVAKTTRSLRYLFSSGDHAVTAYSPRNTILQRSGSHYWYDSADHAVDYDPAAGLFRLRSYVERNNITANSGAAYGDFLPFTYTGGAVQGNTEAGTDYHIATEAVDYWFGMTMQVNFFQTKGGKLGDENMVFQFSGDDDVWVFVDNVLVLDLGGTHGTVNGSINFATGEVLQYLSWNGANASSIERTDGSSTSFPTTIRACFDAAGRIPNGGWSKSGQTFADFSEHTLTFFYLERGSAVANCSLDFRLPTLPDESLTVTKDLVTSTDTEVKDYVADSLYYRFRVMKADAEGNVQSEPFLTAGMTYTLLEQGVKTGTGTIGEDNTFLLKAGQSAQFTKMLQKGNGATQYIVEEIMPDTLTGQYAGVEYLISGEGGNTVTDKNPAESFTAFQTGILSAEQTQTVTFRNRVDTGKLGMLKITKKAAPGTRIPNDLFFPIQVRLGDVLLPVGSLYRIGDVRRTVETPGILLLRAGETAVIEQGILSGTICYVTELASSIDGYRASYSGTVEPEGTIVSNEDGATGTFPLNGTIHITIENADYDFSLQIPIQKRVLDFQKEDRFSFLVEQVEETEQGWEVIETLPETVIDVKDSQTTEEVVTIGYRSHDDGVFYYRITEKAGSENYLYDGSVFIVEVTVSGGVAEITGICKDGKNTDSVTFVNRTVTSLIVTKTITGGTGAMKFPFTAEVFLNGEPFALPEPAENADFTVEGNCFFFQLGHGEQIELPFIPLGAVVKVQELVQEGFLVFTEVEDLENQKISGAMRQLQFSSQPQTIHFINQTGFRLPNTGGVGTAPYTTGGPLLFWGLSAALGYKRLRKGRRTRNSPD